MIKLKVGTIVSTSEFSMGVRTQVLFLNEIVEVTSIDKEIGTYDGSRGSSSFVIEQITMEGSSGRDGIPDQPFIIARKLTKSKKYDPDGELISFFYPGEFHSNPLQQLLVRGHMQRIFV